MTLPKPSLFGDNDAELEELEFERQCRLSDEAELDALSRFGIDRFEAMDPGFYDD